MNSINSLALQCAKALADGDGKRATSLWDAAEKAIASATSGVNLYNILKWNDDAFHVSRHRSSGKLLSIGVGCGSSFFILPYLVKGGILSLLCLFHFLPREHMRGRSWES